MKKAIILLVALVVIGGIVWMVKGSSGGSLGSGDVKYAEPADAVDTFYGQWLKAAKDPSFVPDRATLAASSVLTKELSAKIVAALPGASLDPVLCQSTLPQGITLRNVYEQADKAQMLVTSKDKAVTKQAVVDLIKSDDSWMISGIQCTDGDVAPVKEFSFEQTGFLIKASVPKPYNNKNWHLVFTQDGKAGNVVPLIFDAKSQCTSIDGTKAVCKPEQFAETNKVVVRGGMTERGATVAQLEFVK